MANELNRANGTSINPTGAFIHGAGTPWSNRLIGAQALPNVTRGRLYSIPPINLTRQLWTQVAPAALCAFGFASVLAVMLVLLPQSRRGAKVRLMHIVRIYIYGLTPMVIPTVVVLASAAAFSRTWTNVGIGLFVLAIPLNFVWWWLAISRYLHMQHVPAIAASIGIIGLLIVLIISLGFEGLVW